MERSLSPPPLKKRKFESTTTKKAVNAFFTPASKKEPERVKWRIINETLLLARYETFVALEDNQLITKRRKIAAFDLDSTIIQTSSGRIFSRDENDWKWWHLSVPGTLKQHHADGYTIVIFTNQGSVSLRNDPKTIKSDQRSLAAFKAKASNVLSNFDFPVILLAATARDQYRKPRTGMWAELLDELDLDVGDGPDLESSVFVGDAGGRAARVSMKADHACSDRDFASNVGIEFKTPEEHFLHEDPLPYTRVFEPQTFLSPVLTSKTPTAIEKKHSLDIILFCGSPGSGKSTFYWRKLEPLGYARVNQDTLKTRDKCLKVASDMLNEKRSVAVDNTNADTETRAVWIELSHKFGIPIRCIYFTASTKLCEHNDTVRALSGSKFNPEKRIILPHSAFAGFASRFKQPKLEEGFDDIVEVDFQFQGDEDQRKIWSMYWI